MRSISEATATSILAMFALTQDAEGEAIHHSELTARLDGRAGNMGEIAKDILRVMAELQNLQQDKVEMGYQIASYERLLKDGLPLYGTDRMISLRIDADEGDPSVGLTGGGAWLELVDPERPEFGRYQVADTYRIDKAIDVLTTARQYGTPHEISEAVAQAINELDSPRPA